MSEQFIYTKYRTVCYNCGVDADQLIKVVSQKGEVICANCGATRVFVPRVEGYDVPEGTHTHIGRYDVWKLKTDATCKKCGVHGVHDLVVGANHLSTRCHNCGYAHFYKFDLEYIGQCPISTNIG